MQFAMMCAQQAQQHLHLTYVLPWILPQLQKAKQ